MIKFFCQKIPRALSQPMYAEYSSRMSEVKFLLEHDAYKALKANLELIELLLATSIFYKRVVTNLEAANKFTGTVFNASEAEYIKIGSYKLTSAENRKIFSVIQNYKAIMIKYHIPKSIIEYTETKEFLRAVKDYKKICEYREKDI